ncbi:MAG: LLM class flavin-dependent oxidoreductase [Acidimicrobiales bacterium]|nr:LLM class flavin-dependent oxidoreductase [Acidimicrobiales bacterium]
MILIRFDLRIPPFVEGLTHARQYAEMLEMCRFADEHGFAGVVLSEHHGSEDGFMSAPLVVAAGVLGATRNLFCSVSALLLPLHEPLRVAEDIAAIDLMAPGRINVVAGVGYRDEEFAMFDRDRTRRGRATDEGLATMLKAWKGEPFEVDGRTAWVTPRPASDPHALLAVGGSVEASARRAARHHLPFVPAVYDRELEAAYLAESARVGHGTPFCMMPSGPGLVLVTRDPEALWERIGENLLYDARAYASWQKSDQRTSWQVDATDLETLRTGGQHAILTPEKCVDLIRRTGAAISHPLCGGIDPAIGWESLQLMADEVLPALAIGS